MRADETSELEVAGRRWPLELFLPTTGTAPHPGVLVLHEAFGLNDDIRRIARRFADNGYVAATPNLVGKRWLTCVRRAMHALRSGAGPEVEALEAAVAHLQARANVKSVGVAGFCMGGGFATLLATRGAVQAAGVFYGDLRKRSEIANACPIVGGYGALDRAFASKGEKLIEMLDEAGVDNDIRIYEGAGHSYMNQAVHPVAALLARPFLHVAYDDDAAEDSWRRMLAFFERHLSGSG